MKPRAMDMDIKILAQFDKGDPQELAELTLTLPVEVSNGELSVDTSSVPGALADLLLRAASEVREN